MTMHRLSSLARELEEQSEEATNVGPIGGYDLKFAEEIDEDFKCVVCLDVMRDPYQIVPCGHRFCRTCLGELIRSAREAKRNPTCPNDRKEICEQKMFPDNNCKRKIMCLKVFCNKKYLGCDWKQPLSQLEDHISNNCLFEDCSCAFEGCEELFLRKNKEEHENNCQWKIVKCDLCSDDFRAFELQEHKSISCPCKPVQCPNDGCFILIPENMIQNHVEHICQFSPQNCPMEFLGCTEKGTRSSIKKHIEEKAHQHIEHLCREFKSMKLKMLESEKTNQDELKILQQEIEQLKSNHFEVLPSNEKKDEICFTWLLKDVSKLAFNSEITSPVYSSGPRGYCFCISLTKEYLRGDGYDVAISLKLLPGFFDHLLPWPFKCEFSIHLIDQTNNVRRENLSFRFCVNNQENNVNLQCFGKPDSSMPATSQDMLIVPGHKAMQANYCVNDTFMIFVKVQVYNVETNLGIE